jgi:alkylation response protein AidB-like acyl-CoA dehydrogenase
MTALTLENPIAEALTSASDFRLALRQWLAENFPPELAGREAYDYQATRATLAADKPYTLWIERMGQSGLGVPTWPVAYGGAGLDGAQARILAEEMARARACNPILGMGVSMFGPTLLQYGDEIQKRRHLPPIARNQLRWCQGFSEPGAGSDLAALQMRCEDRGDHWLVNGQKTWTSGADQADWCFCLVRTDRARKQEGISFLMIDMHSPGVSVRPIRLISGASPFCETFFNDVKVPKDNLVGPLNAGWGIGKRLLQHERAGLSAGRAKAVAASVSEVAKRYVGVDDAGRLNDLDLRARIARHLVRARSYAQTLQRVGAEARGAGPSAATSILKNAGARVAQERAELMLEIMGANALGTEASAFTEGERGATVEWLKGKAYSIYGGSQEIQNNIVSKRILNLPEV